MEDPDTQKPDWETIMSTSVTMTSFPVKIRGSSLFQEGRGGRAAVKQSQIRRKRTNRVLNPKKEDR